MASGLTAKREEEQLAGYAEGILSGVAVLTNGKDWYIYNLRKRGDFSDKLVSPINLLDCNVREAARTLHTALGVSNWWQSPPHHHKRLHRQDNGQPRSVENRQVVQREIERLHAGSAEMLPPAGTGPRGDANPPSFIG